MLTRRHTRHGLVAIALGALVLAGCGTQTDDPTAPAAPPTTSESPSVEPTTEGPATEEPTTGDPTTAEPTAGAVAMEEDSVAGIALPAPVDEVVAALEAALGEPTADLSEESCRADGSVMRWLDWGELRVIGLGPDADNVEITSWEVFGTDVPGEVTLPGGLRIGDTEAQVLEALPQGEVVGPEGVPHGGKLVNQGEVSVKLDGDTELVITVSAHMREVSCD